MRLHYRIVGERNLPVILFLHGFMGSGEDWLPIAKTISQEYCCILPDLPGHGKSTGSLENENWGMAETAQWVIAILARENITRCYLAGYSMGGRLALYLALNYSSVFQKILLESASPGLKTERERRERMILDEARAQQLLQEEFAHFLEKWYDMPLFRTLKDHSNFNNMFQRRLQNDPLLLAKSLREMGTGCQPSLWQKWRNLQMPCQFVVGEKDEKFIRIAKEMTNLNSKTDFHIVPGCGHNIHFETPSVFTALLKSAFR